MPHSSTSLQAAFKYLFIAEVPALKELAQSLPPNPVVINLGAGSGTSGLAFMESRPDLFLFTVDIQLEDSPFGCLVAEQRVLREAGFLDDIHNSRYTQIQGTGYAVGKRWMEQFPIWKPPEWCKPVDLVFIDGDHSYEGCKGDIEAWLPNIKPGGILAIHDYKKATLIYDEETCPHPRPWPGVDRAVDELLVGKYPVVMHVQSLIAFRVNE